MSEMQKRMLAALAKLPPDMQKEAVIKIEATADAVEYMSGRGESKEG